jgi:oxygen-dependent protoporphyrinogen oxidase
MTEQGLVGIQEAYNMAADVVIIGAGVSGLSVAFRLQQQGISSQVLEREAVIGGRAKTFQYEDFRVDLSAQFLVGFYKHIFKLIDDVGLHDQVMKIPDGISIVENGKAHKIRPLPLMFGNLLPITGRIRLAIASLNALLFHSQELNVDDILLSAPLDTESALTYGRSHLGQAVVDYLVAPIFQGFFYWDVATTSKALLFFLLRYAAELRLLTLKGGIGMLPVALAEKLTTKPLTSADVLKMHYDEASQLWRTTYLQGGAEHTIESRAVVCSVPATNVTKMCTQMEAAAVTFFNNIQYTINTTVHLFFDQRFDVPPFSHIFYPPKDIKTIAGLVIQSQKDPVEIPPGKEIISVFPGTQLSEELAGKSDEEVTEIVLQSCANLPLLSDLPLRQHLIHSKVVRVRRALPVVDVGYIKELEVFRDNLSQQMPPGLFFAGDFLENPSLEGAIVSGESILLKVAQFLQK